jgi:uncharacterized glyoxalase superfamily protein PhnB
MTEPARPNIFPSLRYRDPDAVIDDPGADHRARAAGARIVRALTSEPYGSPGYSARDLEGNLRSFGTYDPRARQ